MKISTQVDTLKRYIHNDISPVLYNYYIHIKLNFKNIIIKYKLVRKIKVLSKLNLTRF